MYWVLNVHVCRRYIFFVSVDIKDPEVLGPKCPPLQKKIITTKEDIKDQDVLGPKCPPLQLIFFL